MDQWDRPRILLIANRPAVRRRVARQLFEAGLHVQTAPTIADAISIVVLQPPTFVVFDSHLASSEGTHAVTALLRLLETYGLPAIDFVDPSAAEDGGSETAGRLAPLRPKPHLPSLHAQAELPHESVG